MRPWIGSTMKAATSPPRSSASRRCEVAERDPRAARQQRAEALLEEVVADQRQRPEGDAVKAALAGDQPRPARGGARELHRRVHRLGAGAREEDRLEALPGRRAQSASASMPGERRVVDLHAVEEVRRERRLQHLAHVGMVVAEAREALAGVEVQVGAPVGVVEVGALRRDVLLVEAEDPQHVDERGSRWRAASSSVSPGARHGVRDDAERVEGGAGLCLSPLMKIGCAGSPGWTPASMPEEGLEPPTRGL